MNSRVFAGFSQCPGKNPTNPSLNVEASVEPLESCDLWQLDPNTNKLPRHWQQTAASPMPPTEQRWEYGLHAGYSPYFTTGWEMPPKLPLLPGASEPPSNTPFLVPSHVHIPNSILIGSSVSAPLRAVTDRQTYRTSATVGRIWCQTIAIVVQALSQQHCEMADERVTEDWCRWERVITWLSQQQQQQQQHYAAGLNCSTTDRRAPASLYAADESPSHSCYIYTHTHTQHQCQCPGFKSESLCCRVTVLGKLFTPIVPVFTKQQNW